MKWSLGSLKWSQETEPVASGWVDFHRVINFNESLERKT